MKLHFILVMTLVTAGFVRSGQASLVRGPYLQRASAAEITVRWRTASSHTGTVYYGASVANLTNSVSEVMSATNHVTRLAGLNADTTYYYQINDGTNVLAGGTTYFFQTAPEPGSGVARRIWVLGDPGTANTNAQAVYNAYQSFNGSQYTDLMLMLGDNAYFEGTDSEYQAAVFDMYPEILRQTPWFSCFSNHDGKSADSSTQTGPYYEIFTLPSEAECGGVASGTEAYYSFDFGNIHFICLDSFETPRGTNGAMYAWLEQDLAASTSTWKIAFWHHPPYSKGSHDSDTETELIDMRENFLPLLEREGVDLVMGGHSHIYERSYLLHEHYGASSSFDLHTHALNAGDGDVLGDGVYEKTSSGIHAGKGAVYVVAGSSGKVTYTQEDYPHPAMFTSQLKLGSAVIDVEGNQLDVRFLDSSGVVSDRFTILKLDILNGDSDGDGMPDDWELFYFDDPTNGVADVDTDGDGHTNLSEYLAGTNPGNSNSVLELETTIQSNGNMVIGWESATFRNYDLYSSSNLISNNWNLVASNLPATAPMNAVDIDTADSNAFYRVELQYP